MRASDRLSSLWVRLRLFASSYAPLWVIIALRQDPPQLRLFFVLFATAGVLSAVQIFVDVHRLAPNPYRVVEVADRGSEVAGYLSTYLLPFVMVASPTGRDLWAYGLFFLVTACVYVQSNMLAINPLLYFGGLRVFGVTMDTGGTAYLIARSAPARGTVILAAQLGDGVLVETEKTR